MQVPFVDLKAVQAPYQEELIAAATRVIQRGHYILGCELEQFETAFANWVGVPHAVGVANGTDALILALRVLGVGPGDEVLVPAMTFIATAIAVKQVGATPVFVDVSADDLLMDMEQARSKCGVNTKVILPVHLYGQMADMGAALKIAEEHHLKVVEDCAQAHGATRDGHRAGVCGDMGCFSFYPTKNLGALGDAGAVTCHQDQNFQGLLQWRNYGQSEKYIHKFDGINSRLDELQAAFLLVKLEHLDREIAERRRLAALYQEGLAGLPVRLLRTAPNSNPVFHLLAIRTEKRDELAQFLAQKGIHCQIHYPVPVHLQESFSKVGRGHDSCPVAETAARELLSLPLYPGLSDEAVGFVCEQVKQFFVSE